MNKIVLAGLLLIPFAVFGQVDGSIPESVAASPDTPEKAAISTSELSPGISTSSAIFENEPRAVATSTSGIPKSRPNMTTTPVIAAEPVSSTTSVVPIARPVESEGNNILLWAAIFALVAIPMGFLVAKVIKKNDSTKENEDDRGCFNLKKMLDDKLKELTDLKGMLASKAEGMAREAIRDSVQGTSAEGEYASLEKIEQEYSRLKKLYEKCMLDMGNRKFRGTIVENSLIDKSILEKVSTKKSYRYEDWMLHDVEIPESKIEELSKYLSDGPWYIHLWEKGRDDVRVVFKNRIFIIKHSDKSTWKEAVDYGRSIGIPEEQLDFPIS